MSNVSGSSRRRTAPAEERKEFGEYHRGRTPDLHLAGKKGRKL